MKFFWPVYLVSLFVGTAGVYVTAPYARPYMANLFGKEAKPEPSAEITEAPIFSGTLSPRPVTPAPQTVPEPQPKEEEDEVSEVSPALRGVFLASYGEKPGWGVTHQRTTYYKLDGARVGNLPGGMLFDCNKAHQSSKGLMLECSLSRAASTNDHCLISRKDVFLFTGAQTNLSSRQLEALKAYYQIKGKIAARKIELLQASASKNPHFASAHAAYRAFTAHTEKAQELALKRKTATEAEKTQLEDRLREMKVTETKLQSELADANQKFRAWKEQHANEVAKPESDPDIQKWTRELEPFRKQVPGLAL